MEIIKADDVKGYRLKNGEIICLQCMDKKILADLEEDEILTEEDLNEENFFFCDRYKKQV